MPSLRHIAKSHDRLFGAALGNVAKHHRQIDEGVVVVELRIEGARIVPEARVLDANFARAFDAPGVLVEALHGQRIARSVGGVEVADAISEVANLIERVPRRHLHEDAAVNARDDHGHVELVLGRVRQRNFVANRGARRSRRHQGERAENQSENGSGGRKKRHSSAARLGEEEGNHCTPRAAGDREEKREQLVA